jgi:hypothetical protein
MIRARVSSTLTTRLYSPLVRVWLALVAGAAFCTTASGSVSRHAVEQASKGVVQAQFSYDYAPGSFRFSNQRVRIERAGTVLVDSPVRPLSNGYEVDPGSFGSRKSISVADFDADGEPEVALYLYLGGAHCCWYTQVDRYDVARNSYSLSTHVWGNQNARTADRDHDGVTEFVSGDDRFSYQFTDFADSSSPIQVWAFRSGAFNDVTRRFPASIRTDLRRQWLDAFSRGADWIRRRGVLAAWTADECMLGHCRHAFAELNVLRRAGRLAGRQACPCDSSVRAYLIHLRRFLRRTGYLS